MLDKQRRSAAQAALDAEKASLARAQAELATDRAAGLEALEKAVDRLWDAYRERLRIQCAGSVPARIAGWLDEALRTDEPEYMDLPDFPEVERERMVAQLHRLNLTIGTYRNALACLEPSFEEVRRRTGRTPRLLDLASGYGGFPLMLAELARKRGLKVEVSGSDVQPGHVERAAREASEQKLPVTFEVVNGFHMGSLESGDYDLLTILQAIHHFTPGQLARMIAEALRVASVGFVGIDARRDPVLPFWLGLNTLLFTRSRSFAHDAFLSGRKMYDAAELELIARAAAPRAQVRCRSRFPAFNVLEVIRAEA